MVLQKWKEAEPISWHIAFYSFIVTVIFYIGLLFPIFGYHYIWKSCVSDTIPRAPDNSLWDRYWNSFTNLISANLHLSLYIIISIIAIIITVAIYTVKRKNTNTSIFQRHPKLEHFFNTTGKICIATCSFGNIAALMYSLNDTTYSNGSYDDYYSSSSSSYSSDYQTYDSPNRTSEYPSETADNSHEKESWWDKHGDTVIEVGKFAAEMYLEHKSNNQNQDYREYDVHVREYTRKDGTHVEEHYRRRPNYD